jgi:methionyl aminopeptidase
LKKALGAAKAGNPLNSIGKAVYSEARKRGYNVVFELTGHGIGRSLHEEPKHILNYSDPRDKRILNEGLVLAVEPFLTIGGGHIVEMRDGWSLRTFDNTIAAQFEHTIIVTKNEPIILTA